MATDYARHPEARVRTYDASSAGYFIGAAVILAIVGILYITLF
jgi:hypothetical protein